MKTAKRIRRRLPIPQHEFGFSTNTFNLFAEATLDGERITREQAEADRARKLAAQAQSAFFPSDPVTENRPSRRERATNAPSKIATSAKRETQIDTLKDAAILPYCASDKSKHTARKVPEELPEENGVGLQKIVMD